MGFSDIRPGERLDHRTNRTHRTYRTNETHMSHRSYSSYSSYPSYPSYVRKQRGTSSRTRAATRSISAAVVKRESEKRTVARASSGDRPIASSTGLGSTRPEEQAEP